jgi:hypothetical protein
MLFVNAVTEHLTEELLTEHQNEIQRMQNYYDQHKELFEKVARREQLWMEFLDLEVSSLSESFRHYTTLPMNPVMCLVSRSVSCIVLMAAHSLFGKYPGFNFRFPYTKDSWMIQ